MKLSERIKIARKGARLTQEQIAEQLGITKGAVSQWEAGKTEPRNDLLKKIAKITDRPLIWLMGLSDMAGFGEPNESSFVSGKFPSLGENSIQVYGQAAAGPNGEIDLDDEQLLFSVACPPQLCGIRGIYALRVSGNMMAPRYEAGEIIFVDPTRYVRPDDYVVAKICGDKTNRLQAFTGKLVKYSSKELVISQLNPGLSLFFPQKQIVSVGLIAMSSVIR